MSEQIITYDGEKDLGTVGIGDVDVVIQFQHGPIGENGINGIQNEGLLELLAVRLRHLNSKFPCRENSLAITKIEEALMWLERRTVLRREQGVEGQNLAHVS